MRILFSASVLTILIMLALGGCDRTAPEAAPESATVPTMKPIGEKGAWLGQGEFRSERGSEQVKAQLELLADGSYRFMVIEPRALMMILGLEKGNWSRTAEQINLTPHKDQTSTGSSLLARAPKNFRSKSLTVEGEIDALILKDEQMNLRFEPNEKATAKLRESIEI